MAGRLLALALAALLVLLGSPSPGAAEERSAPQAMLERVLSTPLPGRDPVDLAIRLRGLDPATSLSAPKPASPLAVGRQDDFWILDQGSAQLFQVRASLRLLTDHAYWYVEDDLADRAPQADLVRSADVFEQRSYPIVHRYFGSEPSPGVDGDPHIFMLLGNVPGVAAYFSNADEFPRSVNPRSNEHEMIYVSLNSLRPGQAAFDATLTHELQHMVHFARCRAQEGWVDEGAAELATRVAGFEGPQPQAFLVRPDVQLNAWSTEPSDIARHYQAAYLFLRYVVDRAGGWDAVPRLLETCARGEALFGHFLQQQPLAPDVDSLFADWTVANLVDDPQAADGRFAYANPTVHVRSTASATFDTPSVGTLPQFAANYVELPLDSGTAMFSGDPVVSLLDAPADSGMWWSNRGDNLDSRLTRHLDLSGVAEASLRFQAWYDLEDQYDFVYLSASRDGGLTWQVLPGRNTVPDPATGNSFGVGWTGSSGTWRDEEVDLTPFVGGDVLLRFDYVTDQSYTGQGFAFRNVEVPQLGLAEPGATQGAWSAEGWLTVDAPVPERWNLRLVRWTPSGVQVDPVPVAPDGQASFPLDPGFNATRSVLVIAPTAPRTLVAANYSLSLEP